MFQWVAWSSLLVLCLLRCPKWTFICRENDDWCGNQAMQSNVLPHPRLKMRLCRGRESDHARVQLALQIHFGLLPAENAHLEGSRKRCFRALKLIFSILGGRNAAWMRSTNDDSRCRQACELIFYLLHCPKCNLFDVKKTMYKGLDGLPELIFYLLTRRNVTFAIWRKRYFKESLDILYSFYDIRSPKCDFGEIGRAMIHLVIKPCKLTFCPISGSKWDFVEFEKAIIHVFSWPYEFILAFRRPKMQLWRYRESIVWEVLLALILNFFILGGRNATWMLSTKRCFNLLTFLWTHFLPSTQPKMQFGRCQGSYI